MVLNIDVPVEKGGTLFCPTIWTCQVSICMHYFT